MESAEKQLAEKEEEQSPAAEGRTYAQEAEETHSDEHEFVATKQQDQEVPPEAPLSRISVAQSGVTADDFDVADKYDETLAD
jgi:hypothetical protein